MTNCEICTKDMDEHEEFHLEKLCDECAEAISNNWWKWHSGEWLTWNNPKSKAKIKATIPEELRWSIFQRDDYKCLHCGSKSCLTIDHILAESKGGNLDGSNLQTLCRSCNSKKGTN